MGIPNNETTDAAAREAALYGDLSSERALDNDVCAYLICAVFSDDCTHIQYNKLQAVKPSIDVWQSSSSIRKEVLLTCLQKAYTRLTHAYLF